MKTKFVKLKNIKALYKGFIVLFLKVASNFSMILNILN